MAKLKVKNCYKCDGSTIDYGTINGMNYIHCKNCGNEVLSSFEDIKSMVSQWNTLYDNSEYARKDREG